MERSSKRQEEGKRRVLFFLPTPSLFRATPRVPCWLVPYPGSGCSWAFSFPRSRGDGLPSVDTHWMASYLLLNPSSLPQLLDLASLDSACCQDRNWHECSLETTLIYFSMLSDLPHWHRERQCNSSACCTKNQRSSTLTAHQNYLKKYFKILQSGAHPQKVWFHWPGGKNCVTVHQAEWTPMARPWLCEGNVGQALLISSFPGDSNMQPGLRATILSIALLATSPLHMLSFLYGLCPDCHLLIATSWNPTFKVHCKRAFPWSLSHLHPNQG